EILQDRSAQEWEEFLQARHVPAARVRTMAEAIADPQVATRGIIHRHASAEGIDGGFGVPLAAFTFAHGGAPIDSAPPPLGPPRPRWGSTTRRFSPNSGLGSAIPLRRTANGLHPSPESEPIRDGRAFIDRDAPPDIPTVHWPDESTATRCSCACDRPAAGLQD